MSITLTSSQWPDGSQTTRDLRISDVRAGVYHSYGLAHQEAPGTVTGLTAELRQIAAWLLRVAGELDQVGVTGTGQLVPTTSLRVRNQVSVD